MPTIYRPPAAGGFLDGGGRGSSIADLIMANGRAQADAELRGAAGWGDAIGGVTQALTGGLQQYKQRKDDEQVQSAISGFLRPRTAKTPGQDVNGDPTAETVPQDDTFARLQSLPTELRGRAMKGLQDFQEFNSKRQESDLRIKELQDKIAGAQKERQQHDLDTVAVGAFHAKDWLDQPDGGLSAITLLSHQAKAAGIPGSEHYDDFLAGAHDAWQAAQGDPKAMQTVADAVRQQATPLLQQMMGAGSASVQEKFKPETTTLGEGQSLVDKSTGKLIAAGPPKPVNLQLKDTTKGIQTFNPQQGTLGPVIGQPKPPALIVNNNAPKLSDAALDQAAETFYGTGKMPPNLGRGNAGIARMTEIMNRTAQLHPDFNATGAQATFEANKKSFDKLQAQTDAVAAFETTASKNADILEGILGKLPDAGTSVLNAPLRNLAGKVGSEDIASFNAIRQSVQNEYSRIISSPTLSGTMSDSARKEGEAILKGDMTVGQLRAALKILKAETSNRHTSYQGQLDEIMGRIRGKSGGQQSDPLGILK